jgi:hypothetical protein
MMKLGTQTGSLINHLMSNSAMRLPEIGEGATILSWSDRSAGTVSHHFRKGKTVYVAVRDDITKRIDNNGMSDAQTYEYTQNPEGHLTYWKAKGERWVQVRKNIETGRWIETGGSGIAFGYRNAHHDFSF